MTYEITLLEADIRDPMDGSMRLGLVHEGALKAELEYRWDASRFVAVFHGRSPSLPVPAHPTVLLQKPIAAIQALKTNSHRLLTDVFKDHQISIDLGE